MDTQKKIETVQELTDKLGHAKAIILADYRGLKHKQLEELRKALKRVEAEFTIAKNRLMLRALGDRAGLLKEHLEDATAALFSYGDEVAPIKELLKFFKATGAGKTKVGLLGTNILSDSELARFVELPTRPVLLAQLVGQLNAPIQNLHYALSWNINKLVWALEAVRKTKG